MPLRCQLLSGSLPMPSRVLRNPQSAYRTFTTSPSLCARKGGDLGSHLPKHVIPKDAVIPEYPHGASQLFKQSNKGLYGGQMIQFGNNVSSETETKTRRTWKPNILNKALYSVALKKRIKLRLTSKVLKTIDREGGLDEYLLRESDTRIRELGPLGWALRWILMQTPEVIARFRAEAAALGLAQDIIDKQWPTTPVSRELAREQRKQAEDAQNAKKVAAKEQWKADFNRRYAHIIRTKATVQRYKGLRPQKLPGRLHPKSLYAPLETRWLIKRQVKTPGKAAALAYKQAQYEASNLVNLARDIGGITEATADQSLREAREYSHALKNGKVVEAGGKEAWLVQRKAKQLYNEGKRNGWWQEEMVR